jgi:hypothetical protein
VRIEGALSKRWSTSVARLCTELPAMKDADTSAWLRITPDGEAVILNVVLGDGRATSRRVRRPDELSLSVEALTAIPSKPNTQPANDVVPQAAPIQTALATKNAEPQAAQARQTPTATERGLSVEFGAFATGRISRAPTYLSAGIAGYAGLRLRDWLLGLTLRWEPLEVLVAPTAPQDLDMESVGAGFLVARSVFTASDPHLDLGANALWLAEKQRVLDTKPEHSAIASDLRVGLFSRLSFGGAPWRWVLSVDAELSPLSLRRARRIDSRAPTLPTWSLGLGVGASWTGL